jgi:hypothetical protein
VPRIGGAARPTHAAPCELIFSSALPEQLPSSSAASGHGLPFLISWTMARLRRVRALARWLCRAEKRSLVKRLHVHWETDLAIARTSESLRARGNGD